MPVFPHKQRNYQWLALGIIMLVAIFFRFNDIKTTPPGLYPDEAMNGNNALEAIATGDYKVYYPDNNGREGLFMNIQAQSIRLFGNTPWALRLVSAIFGTLTVLGLFLLTKRLFNWQIAAISSFLLATSFWHVLFSRIGFRAIMAPFFLVWGLYFFWKGKTSTRLFDFAMAGVFLGLGFYSYIAYRVVPLLLIFVILAYWHSLKKDFSHDKHVHIRNQMMRGFAMLMVVGIFVALPLGWYYLQNPEDFLGRTSQVSIFSDSDPFASLLINTGKTLGMFNFVGDWNWRHNFAGRPELFWPVGIFFAIGLIRSIVKLWRRRSRHGHFPTVQVLLLSWFFLGLLPVILSSEGIPHALRAIMVAPVVMIFAGEGLWWIYDFCHKWYHLYGQEKNTIATIGVCLLLFGIMINEYRTYFQDWANRPETSEAFDVNSVALGKILNSMPQDEIKYVVVNADGVLVRGIPMPAQTVMYITDTWTAEKQKDKNLYYLTEEQYKNKQYQRNATILPLR